MPSAQDKPPFQPAHIGLIVVGDEILSGKRQDKHLHKVAELLAARGMGLDYAHYVGDERSRITATLATAFASADLVFCTGGIGATPDDHTRQCAAAALGQDLALHPEAKALILERMADIARDRGEPYEPEREDNLHRLNMGVFPASARIIRNPYNKIPGFVCEGPGGARVHFVPGFPVMAWPMIEACLDDWYPHLHRKGEQIERSVVVYGQMEATLTPLMERIEAEHAGIKVFSLPSVDHPVHGRHIELGVKGPKAEANTAFDRLFEALQSLKVKLGPEVVR
jgi:molybdopterin-biosynthesis enzyme MoeA-like protein